MQIEACVAVIVVSVSAFRALFVARQSSMYHEQIHKTQKAHSSSGVGSKAKLLFSKRSKNSENYQSDVSMRDPDNTKSNNTGIETHVRRSSSTSFNHGGLENGRQLELPLRVHVRQDLSTQADVSAPCYENSSSD